MPIDKIKVDIDTPGSKGIYVKLYKPHSHQRGKRRNMRIKNEIKKTYWGLLKYYHTEHPKKGKEIAVFRPQMTYSDCCCAEEGYVLYETKQEALDCIYGKDWQKEKLVKFTVEVIE